MKNRPSAVAGKPRDSAAVLRCNQIRLMGNIATPLRRPRSGTLHRLLPALRDVSAQPSHHVIRWSVLRSRVSKQKTVMSQ
jgi:hypothetical protein